MPHGRTSLTHGLLHVEHLIDPRTIVRAGGEPQLLSDVSVLSEPMMGMGGAVPVEYAHLGLAERAVVDHVVLQPDVVSVAAPIEDRV
eukprot:scaffold69543_cov65-Phaeocystis_antarctica.AAC.4